MSYFSKRMVSFTQKTAGFSSDGKPLLLALTLEKVDAEVTATVLSPNLAQLKEGEYLLALAGQTATVLRLAEKGPLIFTLPERIGVERGACALLLFAREKTLTPVAFGKSGKTAFSQEDLQEEGARLWQSVKPRFLGNAERKTGQFSPKMQDFEPPYRPYADDALATDNYFEWEKEDEKQQMFAAPYDNAPHGDCKEQKEKTAAFSRQADENGSSHGENPAGRSFAHPQGQGKEPLADGWDDLFAPQGKPPCKNFNPQQKEPCEAFDLREQNHRKKAYFSRIKSQLVDFLECGEPENGLNAALTGGFFVRAPFEGGEIVAGVLTTRPAVEQKTLRTLTEQELIALCFGVPQGEKDPPEPLRNLCTFLPVWGKEKKGYWMLFQNPKTGKTERFPF